MTCTDDDLKAYEDHWRDCENCDFIQEKTPALLARLEAAEKFIDEYWDEIACVKRCTAHSECEAYWAWRKAAGK